MFFTTPYGVDLMGVFIKGAAHRQHHRGLIKLGVVNRARNTICLEVSGTMGSDGQGRTGHQRQKGRRTGRIQIRQRQNSDRTSPTDSLTTAWVETEVMLVMRRRTREREPLHRQGWRSTREVRAVDSAWVVERGQRRVKHWPIDREMPIGWTAGMGSQGVERPKRTRHHRDLRG